MSSAQVSGRPHVPDAPQAYPSADRIMIAGAQGMLYDRYIPNRFCCGAFPSSAQIFGLQIREPQHGADAAAVSPREAEAGFEWPAG
jgi:hypothetical protein